MTKNELQDRIKVMMMAYAHHDGKPTSNAAFGAAVGREERVAPYSAEDVQDWLDGNVVPAFSTLMAIGRVSGQSDEKQLGYLAFGSDLLIHELTEDEYKLVHRRRTIAAPKERAP
jgi:hypothetical protein